MFDSQALSRLVLAHGLYLDVEDPRRLNGALLARRRLDATLMRQPRLTTLHDRLQSVALLEAGQARLRLELHDPVGQLVRFTTPSAPSDLRQRCDAYQPGLASRDVLWQVLPCPSRGAGRAEVQAFQDALRTTTAYVRAALNQRPAGRRSTWRSYSPASTRATPAKPRRGNGCRTRPSPDWPARTAHLRAIPTWVMRSWRPSAPGASARRSPTPRPIGAEGPARRAGAELAVAPGRGPRPYNVAALVLWSLAAALAGRPAPADPAAAAELVRLHRLLVDELAGGGRWLLPLASS